MKCNQCEALMINGIFCHETGCPNTHKRYDAETETWNTVTVCFECGCEYDPEDGICCKEQHE